MSQPAHEFLTLPKGGLGHVSIRLAASLLSRCVHRTDASWSLTPAAFSHSCRS